MFASAAATACSSHQVTHQVAPRRASSSTFKRHHHHPQQQQQRVTTTAVRTSASSDTDSSSGMTSSTPTIAPFEFATAARTLFGVGTSKKVPALVKELTELEGCADQPVLIVTGASDRFSKPLVEALTADGTGVVHITSRSISLDFIHSLDDDDIRGA